MRRSLLRGLTLPGPIQGGGGLFNGLRSRCSSGSVNGACGASPAVAPCVQAFWPSPNRHGDGDASWEPLHLCPEASRSWRAPLSPSFAARPVVGLGGHRSAALAGPGRPFSRGMSSDAGPSGSDEAGLPLAQPVPDDAAGSPTEAPKSHRRRKDGKLLCAAEGCETVPSFNIEGARPAYCKDHKKIGMVDVVSLKCYTDRCLKHPSFNYDGEARPAYCKNHMKPGMVNVVHPRCAADGCRTHPVFNYEGEARPAYCKDHIKPGMVNVVSLRCSADGCLKHPSFNYDGEARPAYCKDHIKPDMVNVMRPRCEICVENVKTSGGDPSVASFAREGERPRRCSQHAEHGMVDVISKRCTEPGCKTKPVFGLAGGPAEYCGKHKKTGMVDVKNPRCQHKDCEKQPSFGDVQGQPLFCADHKAGEMKCVTGRMCKHPEAGGCDLGQTSTYGTILTRKHTGGLYLAGTRCQAHKLPHQMTRRQYNRLKNSAEKPALYAATGSKRGPT